MNRKNTADRLYAAREEADLSLPEAAAISGIPFEHLEAMEVGIIDIDFVDATKLAALYEANRDDLTRDAGLDP